MKRNLMKKITTLITAAAVCCGTVLSPMVAEAEEEITLRLGIFEYSANSYPKELIKQFEAEHPGVKIECPDISSNDYNDKMSTMLASGDTVDIVTFNDMSYYAQWIKQDRLLPLNDYIEADGVDLSVYNGLENAIELNGNTYGLPFLSNTYVLFYNKTLFDEAGVEYPSNDMTWEEYRELARKMTSGSGAATKYGAYFHNSMDSVLAPAIANGEHGSFFDEDFDKYLPYLQQVYEMQEEGLIMDYGTMKATNCFYPGYFYNEQMAMFYIGNWFLGRLRTDQAEYDFEWGCVNAPHAEGEVSGETCVNINGFAVNKNAEHADLAWEFVKMATGETGAKIMANLGYMPAIKTEEIASLITSQDYFPKDENSKESLLPKKGTVVMAAHENGGEIQKIYLEELELVRYGEQTPEEAVENLRSRITPLL